MHKWFDDGRVYGSQEPWRQREGSIKIKWFYLLMCGIYQTQTSESPSLSHLVCVIIHWYSAMVLYLAEMEQRISKRDSEKCNCYLPSSLPWIWVIFLHGMHNKLCEILKKSGGRNLVNCFHDSLKGELVRSQAWFGSQEHITQHLAVAANICGASRARVQVEAYICSQLDQ